MWITIIASFTVVWCAILCKPHIINLDHLIWNGFIGLNKTINWKCSTNYKKISKIIGANAENVLIKINVKWSSATLDHHH